MPGLLGRGIARISRLAATDRSRRRMILPERVYEPQRIFTDERSHRFLYYVLLAVCSVSLTSVGESLKVTKQRCLPL